MIRLRTLGTLDLRSSDDTPIHSVLRQPKRTAILAYLALARPRGFHRRDRLLAMFWPELEQDRARHALSQSIHYLRRSLGAGVVENRGDEEIGLAAGRLTSDVEEFEQALERGDPEAALALYQGELLAGFHIADAADFERWLEDERTRLTKLAGDAAWAVAERKGAAGEAAGAVESARQAVALAPWDEGGLRRLIALLDGQGDRAGAVAAYEDYARRLAAAFETEPAAETRDLIEAVRARDEAGDAPPPLPLDVSPPGALPGAGGPEPRHSGATGTPPVADRSRGRGRARWAVLAVVLAVAFVLTRAALTPEAVEPVPRLAVLYLVDQTPDGRYQHIADALTSNLIARLHHPGKIEVVSQYAVRQYRGEQPAAREVGQALDVRYLVAGTVTGTENRIRVTIELVDAANAMLIDSEAVEEPPSEALGLVDEVTARVERFLRPIVGREYRARTLRAGTESSAAWDAVLLAEQAIGEARALEADRRHALAHARLDRADSLLTHARDLDRRWSEPLLMQGRVSERRAWLGLTSAPADTAARRARLDHAIALAGMAIDRDPLNARAWEFRGTTRYQVFLLAPPPPPAADTVLAAAASDLTRSLDIDPTQPRALSTLSNVRFSQGRLREAYDAAEQAWEADAYFTEINNIVNRLFTLAFHMGEDDDAARWCDAVKGRMPDQWPQANCELMLLGWSADARPDARDALLIYANFGRGEVESARAYVRPYLAMLLAAVLVRTGDEERARALVDSTLALGRREPEMLEYEAIARVALGDTSRARALLRQLVMELPTARARVRESRFFADLFRNGFAWLDRDAPPP